jgi:fructose-specific phosphotransferase system IIA component
MFEKNLIVMPDVEFKTKEEVIHYLTHLDNDKVSDKDGYEQDVLERESAVVTYIGYEFGIPHARTETVKEPFAVYARLKTPVHWGEEEGEDVEQVFLLGVPQDITYANLHLELISQLSRNLMHEDFREALRNADNVDDVYQLLMKIQEEM